MKIIAHRGNSEYYNDNTWDAIKSAYNVGADMCEVDIQTTKDGKFVINHDYYLNGRRIIETNLNDIKDIIILEELLEWTKSITWQLLLEVKEVNNVKKFLDVLKGYEDSIVVSGFNGIFLKEFNELCGNIKTSLMIGSVLEVEDIIYLARKYDVDSVHPCWESRVSYPYKLINNRDVFEIRDKGFEIILWHEEREEELVKLIEIEPDGICTNDPGKLKLLKNM